MLFESSGRERQYMAAGNKAHLAQYLLAVSHFGTTDDPNNCHTA
ncbi:MAG: hypothetical protein ACOX0F_02540 [Syntrophomonadaceae bacterium]